MRKKFLVKQKYLLILKIKNKMKNLKNLNLVELNTQEVKNVNGGIFPVAIWGAMIAIDAALITVYAMYDSAGKLKH